MNEEKQGINLLGKTQQRHIIPQMPGQQPQVKMQPLPAFVAKQQVQQQSQIPPQESERVKTNFDKFVVISILSIVFLLIVIMCTLVIVDDIKTKKQIQANVDAVINSPQIQSYRAKQERRQRELDKKRRLKQLGVEGVTEPYQKNDLLNEKLREQELAQKREREFLENEQMANDYTKELAAYNAKLQEVKAEEARILAEAKAAQERARIKAEQERLELERQKAEQERLELERRKEEEKRLAAVMAQQEAEAKARAAEQAELEKAAKLKAAQEKAAKEKEARIKAAQAKAAAAKAKLEAMKSTRKSS